MAYTVPLSEDNLSSLLTWNGFANFLKLFLIVMPLWKVAGVSESVKVVSCP